MSASWNADEVMRLILDEREACARTVAQFSRICINMRPLTANERALLRATADAIRARGISFGFMQQARQEPLEQGAKTMVDRRETADSGEPSEAILARTERTLAALREDVKHWRARERVVRGESQP